MQQKESLTAEELLSRAISQAIEKLYGAPAPAAALQLQPTRREFAGDWTAVLFPVTGISHKSPEQTGEEIGRWIQERVPEVASYNVVKGFLNLRLSDPFWLRTFEAIAAALPHYGRHAPSGKTVVIEYSSPNTNKPLHLGHVRNNLLGYAVAQLLEACGHRVVKVNLVNDRGIHICKSMLAWQKWGQGETPESTGIKGDHLVGKCYVRFDKEYKEQVTELVQKGLSEDNAKKQAPIMAEAQDMLRRWEQNDPSVVTLWEKMNGWVYRGFEDTYRRLGVAFDKTYYESNTYLSGKKMVDEGLQKNVFFKKNDGSVWIDLTADGLDQKLLLRADGTSVYMTQDLGTASERYREYHFDEHVYVVGNEQNYHFQVLRLILQKLGYDWAKAMHHLSYGMVELPAGKMKSREGTVVDADDLMAEMVSAARQMSLALGKLDDLTADEQNKLFETVGLGALKYFILKVDPKKTMLFDPAESIDFNGHTGPFIQYTHARIRSVIRKAGEQQLHGAVTRAALHEKEVALIKTLYHFPDKVREAGHAHSPALVANYAYELAKEFNQYYHNISVLKESDDAIKVQRLLLLETVAGVLKTAMCLLGIDVPERM